MKNKTILIELSKYNSETKVTIKSYLQSGCTEKGYGRGVYEGCSYTQEYTTEWNDGYLKGSEFDGYKISDVFEVLKNKTLSEIGNDEFRLRSGELMNGYSEFDTSWENQVPEELPEDRDLYFNMSIVNSEYEWSGASAIEFEFIDNKNNEVNYITLVLEDDEIE
jgi:hypothetical protein